MAFTPDGMFYLSQKDYAPTMDVLGGAARGMLGLQNKEEAVNEILQSADYDTPEGRRAALEKIRAIDIDAYHKYSKMNQDYEKAELSLKTTTNKGALNKHWHKQGQLEAIQLFGERSLYMSPEEVASIKTPSDINKFLTRIATDSSTGKVDKSLRRMYENDLKNFIKSSRETFMSTYATTDLSKTTPTYKMPDTSFSASGKATKIKDTTNTHLAEQDPDSSKFGLQWDKNKRTATIDTLGSKLKPGAIVDYDMNVLGPLDRIPGVDATLGNVQDALTSTVNAISSALSDVANYFTGTVEDDKQRAVAEAASDWFISNEGHSHFAGKPKELDKILKAKDPAKAALNYYKLHKGIK